MCVLLLLCVWIVLYKKKQLTCGFFKDAKMVLERRGDDYRVVPLSLSGLAPERRFTFYDQVRVFVLCVVWCVFVFL